MEDFELFIGCYGNGTSFSNKSILEHGNYKKIGHVAEWGRITWYVNPESIPDIALKRIEKEAADKQRSFYEKLSSKSDMEQYHFLLDRVDYKAYTYAISMETNLEEKMAYLKGVLAKTATCF